MRDFTIIFLTLQELFREGHLTENSYLEKLLSIQNKSRKAIDMGEGFTEDFKIYNKLSDEINIEVDNLLPWSKKTA